MNGVAEEQGIDRTPEQVGDVGGVSLRRRTSIPAPATRLSACARASDDGSTPTMVASRPRLLSASTTIRVIAPVPQLRSTMVLLAGGGDGKPANALLHQRPVDRFVEAMARERLVRVEVMLAASGHRVGVPRLCSAGPARRRGARPDHRRAPRAGARGKPGRGLSHPRLRRGRPARRGAPQAGEAWPTLVDVEKALARAEPGHGGHWHDEGKGRHQRCGRRVSARPRRRA